MEKVKIVLDWFPNTNHTGILLAKKKGWLEEKGIDLEIMGEVHGVMDMHGADLVCGPECSMLDILNNGTKITAVATFTQKCDSGIVSLKEAGITSPRKLEGKRLTHWSPKWYHSVVGRCVEIDGGDYSKVNLVNLDVGDIVSTLGTVADATWVYANWENEELIQAGKEINYFNLAETDSTFDFCAPAMAASQEMIKNRPQVLRDFLECCDRGYIEASKKPEESVMAVKEFMPKTAGDEMLKRSQNHLAPIFLDEGGHWGYMKPERWNRMADLLVEEGILPKRRDDEFTNEFLPR